MSIKSVILFKTLSRKELIEFKKFLHSPFFNSSNKYIELFETLEKHKSDIDDINAEVISKEVFKTKYSSVLQTRKLFSDFGKLLEMFLCQIQLKNDSAVYETFLLNEFRHRNIPALYRREVRHSRNKSLLINTENFQYYFDKMKIEFEEYSINKYQLTAEQLHKLFEELCCDINFMNASLTLRYYITLLLNRIPEKDFESQTKSVFNFILKNKKEISKNHPKVFIYYLVIQFYKNKLHKKDFNVLSHYAGKQEETIGSKEISNVYYLVFHLLVQKVNEGNYKNIYYAIEFFDKMKNSGIINNIAEISFGTFLNLVNFGLHFKKIDYVRDFINTFIDKVNDNYRYETKILSNALLNYETGNIENIERELNKIHNSNYIYYLFINSLKLKLYYDKDDFKSFNYTLDTFRHYLKRKAEIPLQLRSGFEKFLHFIAFLKIVKRSKYKETCDIESKLKKDEFFYSRDWIVERLGDLKGSK